MGRSENLYDEVRNKPFILKQFIREHATGILGTLAFHLFILILFLLVRIREYREIRDLSIIIDFTEEQLVTEPDPLEEEQMREEEYYAQLLEQQLNASNRAVNQSDEIEDEISTQNFVEEIQEELNNSRSEEWLEQQRAIEEKLNMEDVVPVEKTKEDEEIGEEKYSGPTNILYEFTDPPFNRSSVDLPVPVYKCRGNGIVEVKIAVNPLGNVTSAKAEVIEASHDPSCLAEVAEKYASLSIFSGDRSAPLFHKGKITYHFIAQ